MKTNELTQPAREKTSVAIQGLDTSSPNDIAKDGTCEKLHNIRYKDSAWRPIHEHKVTAKPNLPQSNADTTYNIVYKHPAAPESHYVVENKFNGKYYYYDYDSAIAEWYNAITLIASFDEQQKVRHFGNVLMFMGANSSRKYLLKDGVYQLINLPECASTEIINSSYAFAIPTLVEKKGKITHIPDLDPTEAVEFLANNFFDRTVFYVENITQGYSLTSNLYEKWSGEIMLFTTFRMEDGTNINPSPLHLVKSHGARANTKVGVTRSIGIVLNGESYYNEDGTMTHEETDTIFGIEYRIAKNREASADLFAPVADNTLRSASHILRIRIPEEVDTSAVVSVAVWATRINPTYSFNRVFTYNNPNADLLSFELSKKNVDYYANFDFNQPFYLLEEIKLGKFVKEPHPTDPIYTGKLFYDIILDGVSLENIVNNVVYTPNNNIHDIINPTGLDYNDAFHFFAPVLHLSSPYRVSPNAETGSKAIDSWVDIPIDNLTYNTIRNERVSDSSINEGNPFAHILSYPDYRAKTYNITEHGSFNLTPATANNFALYHAPHTENEKFPPISWDGRFDVEQLPADNSIVSQSNRIQVSSPNNIFSFPFDTSYKAGNKSNRIIALQSAAIEMSDAKFGEMPLYAFTTEGIFALQAGGETLYSNVIPINYDKIINPNTLAINGAIVYITEKGVHLLTSQGSQVISTPIHNSAGMPPLDFLRTCKIIHPKQYNEIVLLNEDSTDGIAYVFNLDAAYWSTRDLKGRKLNTDELYYGNTIYDLADEDESKALSVEITTRPIKLGNVEFKRLETIIPRMSTNDKMVVLNMNVDGSVDGHSYSELRKVSMELEPHRTNPITLRRTPFSAKYFKCHMLMKSGPEQTFNPSITHIDLEWYLRFMRRMR